MSDPNLPEGVTQRDIDHQPFEEEDGGYDSENCKHGAVVCEVCIAEKKDKEIESLQSKLSSAEKVIEECEKALENIETVTHKPMEDFSALVSGATKMNCLDLIEFAKDGDALGSLVNKFAEKALASIKSMKESR